MMAVERSDSLRSDNSRARVSFNKDVHVKRIGGRGDRVQDAKEAEEVLRKAHSVESIAHYNSLPRSNKKPTVGVSGTHSLDRRGRGKQPKETEAKRSQPKKQLSPILEAESPWADQLYATVRKPTRKMESEPSARIKRLLDKSEGYRGPEVNIPIHLEDDPRPPPVRRHSAASARPDALPPVALKKKKKSLPEKVKSIFSKKKKDEENKDPLKERYVQYSATNGYGVNNGYREKGENQEIKETWLKSLDRRLRKTNNKTKDTKGGGSSSQEENTDSSLTRSKPLREKTLKPLREKPLRFFGDTEDESDAGSRRRDDTGYHSATSSKSVVYLHSPTVGDIPGRRGLERRSASREELSPRLERSKRTVSRSVSVLAPWRPSVRTASTARPSSGDETDTAPVRPPRRRLVFTGPPLDTNKPTPSVHRTTSLYSRANYYGKTRK